MKNIQLIISLFVLLFSCKKEEPTPTEETNNSLVNGHYAYFEGMVTDSLTGDPITGYNIEVNGPQSANDSLVNGNYSLYVYWFEGHFYYSKPTTVELMVIDSTNSIIKYVTFDGNLLVENDTVTVDLQVNL